MYEECNACCNRVKEYFKKNSKKEFTSSSSFSIPLYHKGCWMSTYQGRPINLFLFVVRAKLSLDDHPSKYQSRPTLLNFGVIMGIGISKRGRAVVQKIYKTIKRRVNAKHGK